MKYLEYFSDEQILEMQEVAYNLAISLNDTGKDIMAIALVEINRELDERQLNETKAGG